MGTRQYEAYYDSDTNKSKVIAKDDDGYWFNAGVEVDGIETAKRVAQIMEESER